jgi:uncharacterized protein
MSATGAARSRIVTLDVIRGVAVMGIFSVNVVGMAMIEPAYFYPPIQGFETVWDRLMWAANFILIDHKMRSLFSMLFGASALLVMDRAGASGRSVAVTHYARMASLLLLGLIHFYAIWWGDILTTYAAVGMTLFFFRKLAARWLLVLSVGLFAFSFAPPIERIPETFAMYDAAHAPNAGKQAIERWNQRVGFFTTTPEQRAGDIAMHSTPAAHARIMAETRAFEWAEIVADLWKETLALMLLGMAGYRSGFLTGQWSDRSYLRTAAVGLGIGVAGYGSLAAWVVGSNFRFPETISAFFALSGPLGPVMALGYAALIILLARRPTRLRARLAAVGRAAFTNYLGASLIGVIVFFDMGLGLYGDLTRGQAWLLVPLVWLPMLAWSKPWLDRFAYGPFEWLWRSLARWEVQPMRKRLPVGALATEA